MISDYITFASARATQADCLGRAVEQLTEEIGGRQAAGSLDGPGPIFVGIGASLAAVAAPVWSLRSRGIHSWRLGSGDLPLPFPTTDHPIIGVSQSGRSAETLAVLETLDPSLRYAVVNNSPSPIADLVADHAISLGNIPDSYASTIGFTATIAALGLLADSWNGGGIGSDWLALGEHFREIENEVGSRAADLASTFAGVSSADFVGAGPAVGSAEEGALLFREVARLPSTAMSTRTYLHGSMESAGSGVHVLFGDGRELEMADTLSEAGHKVILITGEDVAPSSRLQVVRLPRIAAAPRAILEALVMQILVEEVAHQAGIDIEEFVFTNSDTKIENSPMGGAGQ
jgi:glucosamine--fructose-6-phosphate aminotransferase (isomerizing)